MGIPNPLLSNVASHRRLPLASCLLCLAILMRIGKEFQAAGLTMTASLRAFVRLTNRGLPSQKAPPFLLAQYDHCEQVGGASENADVSSVW